MRGMTEGRISPRLQALLDAGCTLDPNSEPMVFRDRQGKAVATARRWSETTREDPRLGHEPRTWVGIAASWIVLGLVLAGISLAIRCATLPA